MFKRVLLGSTLLSLLLAVVPAEAQSGYRGAGGNNQLRARIGNFEPDGESEYWEDKFFDFTGSTESFEDVVVGIDFIHSLGPRFGVMLSGSGYETDTRQAYRDFEDFDGRDISHRTTFELATASIGLVWQFAGRNASIQPYVGAGGSYYDWTLEESGDFIDFDTRDLIVFTDTFFDDGTAFGSYFLAGLNIPLGDTISVFAEGRWESASDDLSDDFEGLGEIDLGGTQISAGLAWHF